MKKFFVYLITVLFLFNCFSKHSDKDENDSSLLPFLFMMGNGGKNQNLLLSLLVLEKKEKKDESQYHEDEDNYRKPKRRYKYDGGKKHCYSYDDYGYCHKKGDNSKPYYPDKDDEKK